MTNIISKEKIPQLEITKDGKKRFLVIKEPSSQDTMMADRIKSKVFYEGLNNNVPTNAEIEKILEERNIWSEDKQRKLGEITKDIADKEYQLTKGGIKLSKAKRIALAIRSARLDIRVMVMEKNQYYNNSAEGQAENQHFNCLLSRCLVYNDDRTPYFKDLEDYLTNEDGLIGMWGATHLAKTLYGIGQEAEKELIENEFLIEYDFVNSDLSLIDGEQKLVDTEGNLVDSFGNKIDKKGNILDGMGRPRDEHMKPIVKKSPFLSDDGKDIVKDVVKDTVKKKTNVKKISSGERAEAATDSAG